MRKFMIFSIVLVFNTTLANAQTASGLSALDIFDQYVISKSVALSCLAPDSKLDADYDANFAIVYKKAWQRLRNLKKSTVTKEEITTTLDNRITTLRTNVSEDVKKEGCDTKAYKELVNLYKYHATWNPFAGGS